MKKELSDERVAIIIDGKNFCYRHSWTHKELRSGKIPTGMLYGAISGMLRLARLRPGALIVFCWDGATREQTWRHRLSATYKANRKGGVRPPFVQDMDIQIPLFRSFLDLLGFRQFAVSNIEADDLVGLLSRHIRSMVDRVVIYSTDKDFYQLIRKNICVVSDTDKTKECRPVREKDVFNKFGVVPRNWLKYRALIGDPGDNIIKPKGFGNVKVAALLAAGVDASDSSKHELLTEEQWIRVKLNHELSRIVRKPTDKVLSRDEQEAVLKFLSQIKSLDDMRRTGKRKEVRTAMMTFLAQYEMHELMQRRAELWSLI